MGGDASFPYLGDDEVFKKWLLTNDIVKGPGANGVEQTFVTQLGTYDLVAAICSAYQAAMAHPLGSIYNYLLGLLPGPPPGTLDNDQQDLIDATNTYFRKSYGLDQSTPFKPGDNLLFNGTGAIERWSYLLGSLGNDDGRSGAIKGHDVLAVIDTQGSGAIPDVRNQVVNAGEGDDIIVGSAGNDLLDGAEGFDTVDYRQAMIGAFDISLDAVPGSLYRARAVVKADAPLQPWENDLYGIEKIVLGDGDDKLHSIDRDPGNSPHHRYGSGKQHDRLQSGRSFRVRGRSNGESAD